MPIPKLGIHGVLDLWRGSVPAPPKLLATGKWLVVLQSSTYVCRFTSLDFCFAFLSPAAKMPWTSASGDDTMVGQSVPSTMVDPSKETETVHSASSSNVNITVDAGKRAMIVKPARKFDLKGIALKRAPS